MDKLTSIVVGIDFSECSAAALKEAIRLARWNRATIRVIHIIDTLVVTELEEALSPFQQKICDGLVDDSQREWERFSSKIDGAKEATFEVRIDNRVRGLLAEAREAKADLLVLGAFGTRKPDVGMGTIATACVRHATCPVLLVRDTMTGPFRRAVACVDFSPTSLKALDEAARICTQDGAQLHVLHVFQPLWQDFHYPSTIPEPLPEFNRQYQTALERRVRAFAASLGREIDFLKPTFRAVEYPGHRVGIVEYAKSVNADLIVLGTRGKTNMRDLLLGSTAEKVLRESPCSVLALKPEGVVTPQDAGAAQQQPVQRQTAVV
jgi:nucleotide-binding universal stress UspA family protein